MWDGTYYTRFFIDPREELIGIFLAQMTGSWSSDLLSRVRPLVYQAIID